MQLEDALSLTRYIDGGSRRYYFVPNEDESGCLLKLTGDSDLDYFQRLAHIVGPSHI